MTGLAESDTTRSFLPIFTVIFLDFLILQSLHPSLSSSQSVSPVIPLSMQFSIFFIIVVLNFALICASNASLLSPFCFRIDFVFYPVHRCAVVFLLCSRVPFVRAVAAAVSPRMRPGAEPSGAVVPAARLVSIRDTTVRTVRTVQRWACGYSTTSVEKQSTAPRETLLDCSVRSSFWIFSALRLAASRSPSTEWLLERLRFPLSREAGDSYVPFAYVRVLTEYLLVSTE